MTKDEADYTLEDWVKYHTSECKCAGAYQCPGCTLKELDESWRQTLKIERESFLSLRRQHEALKRVAANLGGSDA